MAPASETISLAGLGHIEKGNVGFGNGRVIEILDNIYYVSDLPFCLLRLSSLNEFLAVEAVIGEPVSVLISLLCGNKFWRSRLAHDHESLSRDAALCMRLKRTRRGDIVFGRSGVLALYGKLRDNPC